MDRSVKLSKLTQRIQAFAKRLERTREFTIHRHVDQFYYMQKAAELKILIEQFEETQGEPAFLASRMDEEYVCVFNQWYQDVRWLQHYEMTYKSNRPEKESISDVV